MIPWITSCLTHVRFLCPCQEAAHSMFFEVVTGGGVASFAFLIALSIVLLVYAAQVLAVHRDRLSFATSALFLACLLFGFMGEEIDSGPVAVGFWFCVAALPYLYEEAGLHPGRILQGSREPNAPRLNCQPLGAV